MGEVAAERRLTRVGELHEYKAGHYYVSRVDWEDGHTEIEVHRCQPELLFHSCDPKEWDAACEHIDRLAAGERQDVRLVGAPKGEAHDAPDQAL